MREESRYACVFRTLYSIVSLDICSLIMSQLSTSIISTFIMDESVNAVKQQPLN